MAKTGRNIPCRSYHSSPSKEITKARPVPRSSGEITKTRPVPRSPNEVA